jgi:homoserine O-acetyltransferase
MPEKPEPTREADFTFAQHEPFPLTGGDCLRPVTMRYAVYGQLNARRDNVILVCHALSGSARVGDWWPELFGPDRPFDTSRFAVVGINVLGSCYGSTGPASIDPHSGRRYAGDFPVVSILDVVRAQARVMDHLGVERLHAVVGGSIGGMQALSWAAEYPERVARAVCVGAAPTSAMALALSHLQRQAIRNDPAFRGGHYPAEDPPRAGLALARGLAMCSYKSAELYDKRYHRRPDRSGEDPARSHDGRFDVAGYLDYQGRVFNDRFDANSYLVITRAMDTWDLGSTPEEEAKTMRRIEARALLVGISSDWLFPAADVRSLAGRLRAAGVDVRYEEMTSSHGHDAFLADADDLVPLMAPLLEAEAVEAVGGHA